MNIKRKYIFFKSSNRYVIHIKEEHREIESEMKNKKQKTKNKKYFSFFTVGLCLTLAKKKRKLLK